MRQLQVTNTGEGLVVLQDFEGYSDFRMEVPVGETMQQSVMTDVLERLESQLNSLAADGWVKWLLLDDPLPRTDQSTRVDLWLDGTNGDDAHGGTSLADAVKTVRRLRALIPKSIETNYFVVNVRGPLSLTADNNDALWFNTKLGKASDGSPKSPTIIIQGDTSARAVHLDDGSGGNIVSDFNAVGQVGLTTATWTENEHRGYWCEFKTGALAGQTFTVDHNDATKLYLMNCTTDPGAGAEFVLVQPLTEVTAGPFWMGEDQSLTAILNGPGALYMSHIHFTGGATFSVENTQGLATSTCMATNCIIKADAVLFGFVFDGGGILGMGGDTWDLSSPIPVMSFDGLGVSVSGYPPICGLWLYCTGVVSVFKSLVPEAHFWYCNCAVQVYVSSFHYTTMLCSKMPGHGGDAFGAYGAGWLDTPTRFGGHRAFGVPTPDLPSIEMFNSEADFQKSKIVDSTMALRMIASKSVIQEAEGDDHTVCGVHADALSAVFLPPGTVPTLAGNGATVELSKDGTTQLSAWSAIATTPVSDPEVVCKEYAPTFAWSFPV